MKLFLVIAFVLASLPNAVHAQIVVPTCFPSINGLHYGAPQVHFGKRGNHFVWACTHNTATHPPQVWAVSCRDETCSDAAISAAQQAVINLGLSGLATRVQEARRQYAKYVTVDCPALLAKTAVPPAEVPDWYMCNEQARLINAFKTQWFPGMPASTTP